MSSEKDSVLYSTAIKGTALTPQQTCQLIQDIYLSGHFEIVYPTVKTTDKLLELAVNQQVKSAKIFDIPLATLILASNIDYFGTYNLNHLISSFAK